MSAMKGILRKARRALRHPAKVPRVLFEKLDYKFKDAFLWESNFGRLPEPRVRGAVAHEPQMQEQLVAELRQSGFSVTDYRVEVEDFRGYLQRAGYAQHYPDYYDRGRAPNFIEKALEHYLAAKLLALSLDDLLLDIASARSPAADIYRRLYACRAYSQDLTFPPGLHDNTIGGNAAELPLPDGFATKMALHCSFEHFEGETDIRFLQEAGRVLRPGGELCILPLYLHPQYAIQTDPAMLPRAGSRFEPDAVLYAARGFRNRHGRFYDVPHLISRVRKHLNGLGLKIFVVQNEKEVEPSCYLKFAALFEKPPG